MKQFEVVIFQNRVNELGNVKVSRWHSEPINSIDQARPILIREFESAYPATAIYQPNGSIKNMDGETIFKKNDRRIGTDKLWFSFEIIEFETKEKPTIENVTPETLVIESFVFATNNLMKWIPTFKDRLSTSEFEIFSDMLQDFEVAKNLNDRIKMH